MKEEEKEGGKEAARGHATQVGSGDLWLAAEATRHHIDRWMAPPLVCRRSSNISRFS